MFARASTRAVRDMVAEATELDIERRIPKGNGHVSEASMAFLVQHVPPERIIGKLNAMLDACTPQGNPDWRAQSDAVKLWLNYVVGLPLQRQETTVNHVTTAPTAEQLLANLGAVEAIMRKIAASPDARAVAIRILEEWKAGAIDV